MHISWPRIQFHEIGDQPWCPDWLHHHEQFSLTQLWNLRVPFWSRDNAATQACGVIKEHIPDLSSTTIVDACAGAGGPTPFIERELNRDTEKNVGREEATQFVLTDMFPPVDVWARIAKKQNNIRFIEKSVDARAAGRIAEEGRKECRVFNVCFHHFSDRDAKGILKSAIEEADSFIIFEVSARHASTCLYSALAFFWGFYVTLFWYWASPVHLFFTFALPVAPLALWIDGFISCLRTRTPEEIVQLIDGSSADVELAWKFSHGEKTVLWPFITLYYFVGRRVIIVGAGLGGLACAIACRRENLDAVILERSPDLREIGAGVQIPPNGARIIQKLGLLPQILEEGSIVQHVDFRRYEDGRILKSMPFGEDIVEEYGVPWVIIHREDFHRILRDEATRLGAEIRLGAEVTDIVFEGPEVILAGGERVAGDVIIAADGLYSQVRDLVLSTPTPPEETGDLAYRAIFHRSQLEALNDPNVNELCNKTAITSWLGPDKHSIFYPVHGGEEFNLVLLRPDNLDKGVRRLEGKLDEMRDSYAGWDETGPVALLGDACHPTLPYQAQGAAMAVEDGFTIGALLGMLDKYLNASPSDTNPPPEPSPYIPYILSLYESIRKARTTATVQVAVRNRRVFHVADGILQMIRDFLIANMGVTRKTDWTWFFSRRMRATLDHDLAGDCERAFDWWKAD
ncbi:hypothetical protein BDV06DRAFT_215602 [Aspergillus oleicola]